MKSKLLSIASALALANTVAQAQTTPPPPMAAASAPEPAGSPFSANIAVTTKYKFRGQDQGNTKWFSPAVQGGFDWSSNGFYLGNWNSNVSFGDAAIEMDFYGGYKGEITKDFGYDVGILQYYYPQKNKTVNFDVTEIYGALAYQWLSLKYSHTVSRDYFGIGEIQNLVGASPRPKGRNTGYLDLTGNYPFVDKLTLNAHVGYTRYASDLRNARVGTTDVGVPNFYDYKLGLTYDLSAIAGNGVTFAGAVVGASKKNFYGDVNKARLILTLAKAL